MTELDPVIAAAYDAAVMPGCTPVLLGALARLFRSHFADTFVRSHDYAQVGGVAIGLDRDDYEGNFLGTWVKRNVWGSVRPVRVAGEVVSTRQMVPKELLLRSEMYNEYLAPRGLHEGLRLAIAADADGVQDVSLLRPWSAGPFEASEIVLAERLLPHLQRAALVSRRLGEAAAGSDALDALAQAVVLIDARGGAFRCNAAAERLLAEEDGLAIGLGGRLVATAGPPQALERAVAEAIGASGLPAGRAAQLRLLRLSGRPALPVTLLPVRAGADLAPLRRAAALALIGGLTARRPAAADLVALFGLTQAEAALALDLLAGRRLPQIAAAAGRSVNTLRTHLARVMAKTETRRQSELVRLLADVTASL